MLKAQAIIRKPLEALCQALSHVGSEYAQYVREGAKNIWSQLCEKNKYQQKAFKRTPVVCPTVFKPVDAKVCALMVEWLPEEAITDFAGAEGTEYLGMESTDTIHLIAWILFQAYDASQELKEALKKEVDCRRTTYKIEETKVELVKLRNARSPRAYS